MASKGKDDQEFLNTATIICCMNEIVRTGGSTDEAVVSRTRVIVKSSVQGRIKRRPDFLIFPQFATDFRTINQPLDATIHSRSLPLNSLVKLSVLFGEKLYPARG